MGTRLPRVVLLAAAPVCFSLALAGDPTESKSVLGSVRFGEHWYGPKLGTEDLKGRVTLIDFWGLK